MPHLMCHRLGPGLHGMDLIRTVLTLYSITLFQENQLKKLTGLNLTAVADDATRSMATKQVARLMYLIMVPAAQPRSQALTSSQKNGARGEPRNEATCSMY